MRQFRVFLLAHRERRADAGDLQCSLHLGRCLATIAYAQLIAENARCLDVEPEMIAAIFHLLVSDLGAAALALASLSQTDADDRVVLRRMVAVPQTGQADWDRVAARMEAR